MSRFFGKKHEKAMEDKKADFIISGGKVFTGGRARVPAGFDENFTGTIDGQDYFEGYAVDSLADILLNSGIDWSLGVGE